MSVQTDGPPREPSTPGKPLLELAFGVEDIPGLRLRVGECAAEAGLAEPRRGDFVLAVHEVACNAVEHGGGTGQLVLEHADGALHCRVADDGPGFTADLVPAEAPGELTGESGRGLWLSRQLTDRMDIARGTVGAVVTLVMGLSGGAPD
ncbi:ATP-binding protein [Streptomyces sp. S07_1.15]|uniref:ATP-binding protein n=1 Tax=Streptomyces sp. S07_1.15 TaxID=2873925 RepID=UPI001D13FC29|nr:ATP-binding protein [Streptomyces sp. S07_1.15]MCC3653944.1 ATP-binding protein [Streptomyces sp. S07_1.15]